jgi:hypothetical protein
MSSQSLVAKLDGLFVQVQARRLIPPFGHSIQQSPSSTRWLQDSLCFLVDVFFKRCFEKLELRDPIAREDQIVINGMVVNAVDDGVQVFAPEK